MRAKFPDALVVDLLRAEEFRRFAARPERLRELVGAVPPGGDIVVDEIQRVPELLNVVHELMESGKRWRFVLTGSSARTLRRGGVNLLAGRAILRTMHPFMAGELGAGFDLGTALSLGTVPTVLSSSDPAGALSAYASLYVEQEVRAEGLARDAGSFSRFLEAIAFSHAATLNVSEVARECETSRSTVSGYVELVEDLLLAFRLPVFSRRAKRRLVAHPRFFYFDCGVFRSLRPSGPLDRPEEIAGPALEGLVAQHLRAWLAYSEADGRLYYWRTRAGAEVDFVLYGATGIWGIDRVSVGPGARSPAGPSGLQPERSRRLPRPRHALHRSHPSCPRTARPGRRCRCLPCRWTVALDARWLEPRTRPPRREQVPLPNASDRPPRPSACDSRPHSGTRSS